MDRKLIGTNGGDQRSEDRGNDRQIHEPEIGASGKNSRHSAQPLNQAGSSPFTVALHQVGFEIPPAQQVVILGHNGSGKSTLLRCITRLIEPTSGQIELEGEDILHAGMARLRAIRLRMGMVFQKFHLIPNLSVFQNVLFGGLGRVGMRRSLSWFAPQDQRTWAMECLDRVGLADLATRRADRLSGGQQQRVAIARTLLQRPRLILADEPVASLDPRAGHEVMELLWSIAAHEKLTILCTLHQIDLARKYAQRIIGLARGKLVFDDSPTALDRQAIHRLYHVDHSGPEPVAAGSGATL